jgi:hypothetical protein
MTQHRFLAGLLLALAIAPAAQAHKASDAYLTLRVDGERIEQRLDIALRDLDRDLALDADDDGELRWGEVRGRWSDIERLADAGVQLAADGRECRVVARGAPQLDEHTDGRYAVLQRSLRCSGPVAALSVDYRLFQGSDATHRGMARVIAGPPSAGNAAAALPSDAAPAEGQSAVLEPGAPPHRFALEAGRHPGPSSFLGFVVEGAHHIAIGLDHVLFLVTLLMVAAWRRADGGRWVSREGAGPVLGETLRLVTAFTVAHSITLALAASGVLSPPSRWVESLIAASVLVAALDNLWPIVRGPRWTMVACFGLVHGFGFAGPLQDLGLQRGALALPLLGFNLGVELGQLAIVALLLPVAFALRDGRFYRQAVVRVGSLAIAGTAAVWVLERGFDLSLMP